MDGIAAEIDRLAAEIEFSGVVRVDTDAAVVAKAYGFAHRGWRVPNDVDTMLAIASGTKGLTALTVMSLVSDGRLGLDTPARELLGADLPLVDGRVTVEHLLAHRSGIGDYLDEDTVADIDDHTLDVAAHLLDSTPAYLNVLDGRPMVSPPAARFAYNNSGYVILALIAERVGGAPFAELVATRVCAPAGMSRTAFLRSDELPGGAATGYLDRFAGRRSNVMHLPVVGSGDGGAYTTVADMSALWRAVFAGAVVPLPVVAEMVRPRSDVPDERRRYGLGFWLHETSDVVMLVGSDAGVSFRSVHRPSTGTTHTVIANTSRGAGPLTRALDRILGLDVT